MSGTTWEWILGWALPGIAAPILLGMSGQSLSPAWLIWLLAAIVAWQIAYRRKAPAQAGHVS